MTSERVCLFCLAPDAMSVKFDRRGKPFLRCFACGVRAFMPSFQSLNGVAILTPYAESVVEQMAQNRAVADEKRRLVAALVDGIRAKLVRSPAASAGSSSQQAPAPLAHGGTRA